jgi:hypothetical protein
VFTELQLTHDEENPLNSQMTQYPSCSLHHDVSEYVADLQLHMTLQARNLVPPLTQDGQDSREQMLQQTQAYFEKMASRQASSMSV